MNRHRLNRRDRPLLDESQSRLYLNLIERACAANQALNHVTGQWLSKLELRRLASDLRFGFDCRPSALSFEQWLGLVRFIEKRRR